MSLNYFGLYLLTVQKIAYTIVTQSTLETEMTTYIIKNDLHNVTVYYKCLYSQGRIASTPLRNEAYKFNSEAAARRQSITIAAGFFCSVERAERAGGTQLKHVEFLTDVYDHHNVDYVRSLKVVLRLASCVSRCYTKEANSGRTAQILHAWHFSIDNMGRRSQLDPTSLLLLELLEDIRGQFDYDEILSESLCDTIEYISDLRLKHLDAVTTVDSMFFKKFY